MTGMRQLEFCTLFDQNYIPYGLVLYRSLAKHCPNFRLHVFCMDDPTEQILVELDLACLVPIALSDLERHDPELAAVRPTRSHAEYCWTASAAICKFVLDRDPDVAMITRLDVDLEFYADPTVLLEELDETDSAMIVPHRLSPEFRGGADGRNDDSPGIFNAQFETFRRNRTGLAALNWWRERCLEWCYDRVEGDRYGDQWYLDRLPDRFRGIRVMRNIGGGVGPWNVAQYRLEIRDGGLLVDEIPVVFHHFQSLEVHAATPRMRTVASRVKAYRLSQGRIPLVWTTGWRLSEQQLQLLWEPYVRRLGDAMADLREVAPANVRRLLAPKPGRIAFHIVRRRVSPRIRSAYWRVREAVRQRRRPGYSSG